MRKFLGIGLLLLLFSACREPMGSERFIAGDGPYLFPVDMTDSTAAYDFDFFTRVDAAPDDILRLHEIPLDIRWEAPSGRLYPETVWLPMQGKSSFFTRDIRTGYRSDVRPYESGLWRLRVSIPDTVSVPGLRGLGLLVTKKR